jgi:hypothetical protein
VAESKPLTFSDRDAARDAHTQKYGIGAGGLLRYPLDLTDQSPHYIIFYPLVREGSRLGENFKNTGGQVFDKSSQNGQQPGNATAQSAALGAGIGTGLGIAEQLANGGGKNAGGVTLGGILGSITSVIAKGAIGGAAGAAVGALSGSQELYTGAGGIALQMPENKMSSGYKATWKDGEMGALLGAIGAGNQSLLGAINPLSPDNMKLALRSGGKLSKVLSDNALDVNKVLESNTKSVTNPYKEQFFKSMENRSFVFEYNFAPRSLKEAEAIFSRRTAAGGDNMGIIQKFAYHMHPELRDSGYFFNYPSEFSIVYYHAGKENQYVRKISTCVLTGMSVDYGSDTGFTTFKEGMPTHATMRLEFLELELMTAQRVYQGF